MNLINYKKTIINAGKISQKDLTSKNNKAFSIIELLFFILIITLFINISYSYYNKTYYKYRADIFINKFKNILNIAKTTAVTTNKDIFLCPYNHNKKSCDNNWHNSIIIFTAETNINNKLNINPNNFINNYKITSKNIIFKINPIINKTETINIISFNNFTTKPYIKFDKNGNNHHLNSTVYYKNLYYNKQVVINKSGRIK